MSARAIIIGNYSATEDGFTGRVRTSRQHNTHNIESREVRYPWHPWHARAVAVHEALTKNGRGVFRCGIDENPGVRLLEIPQWMFDSVACCRMRLSTVPTVSCGALLDLKATLRCASFPVSNVVLQSQHRSLLSPGDADGRLALRCFCVVRPGMMGSDGT